MKKLLTHIAHILVDSLLLALFVVPGAYGQKATSAQVIVLQVKQLNKINLIGGPLTLQINSVDDNATEPTPAVDASTKLLWTSNGDNGKIAVGSNITSPRFTLRIEAGAISPGAGIAEPEVTLSDNEPHNLILGVQRSAGSCTLKFTAIADVDQGVGSESRLITYTITGG
jgi:hypothetical protein